MTGSRLLFIPQVAERLGVDVRTVRRMIGLGQLASVWVGSRKKVPEPAVDEFERLAFAANIGTQTAFRLLTLLATASATAPHVTGEDGR